MNFDGIEKPAKNIKWKNEEQKGVDVISDPLRKATLLQKHNVKIFVAGLLWLDALLRLGPLFWFRGLLDRMACFLVGSNGQ